MKTDMFTGLFKQCLLGGEGGIEMDCCLVAGRGGGGGGCLQLPED